MAKTMTVTYDGPANTFNGKRRGESLELTDEQILHHVKPVNGGHRFIAKGGAKLPEGVEAAAAPTPPPSEEAKKP